MTSTIACLSTFIFKRSTHSEASSGLFLPYKHATTTTMMKVMASPPTISAPKREAGLKKRVVITGMGVALVFGNDIDAFYNKLLDGVSGITPIDRFDASEFSVRFAGQIRNFRKEGYVDLDDCWRYCLVAGETALDNANLGAQVLRTMNMMRMGVLVGTGTGSGETLSKGIEAIIGNDYAKISPFSIPFTTIGMGSALLAMETGLMGPTYTISSACATANHSFLAAANHIRRGDADVMMAEGMEAPIFPASVGGFMACRALSERNEEPEKASRPWDKGRDGFVMGEGAGILVMESLEHAMKRGAKIIAEFLGGAINCDAYHMTNPRMDGFGVSICIIKSLENARVAVEEVNYVNAHATSIPTGDLVELHAIKKVFKNTSEIKMNATKSMVGHGLAAASGLEAITTIKAITTGWLHPTINQYDLDPAVTIDNVPNLKKQHQVNVGTFNTKSSSNKHPPLQENSRLPTDSILNFMLEVIYP